MKEPWFWRDDGIAASAMRLALAPASAIYDAAGRIRFATTHPVEVGAPVICIGNATLGGAGKTPFALALQSLIASTGAAAHFATRGYGGRAKGPLRVEPHHRFHEVGDEALLLAASAPTFVSKNRVSGARMAAAGADLVIMDDGYQNPAIAKQCSFLLLGGGESDDRVFPAGRLREPLAKALGRADAIVSRHAFESNQSKPLFSYRSEIGLPSINGDLIAFCGIAGPSRFFGALRDAGAKVIEEVAFADHHVFNDGDIAALFARAKRLNAQLITTEKDFVRLPDAARGSVKVAKLYLTIDNPGELVAFALAKCGLLR